MTASLQPTHEAPFRGLRVLDFGQGVASPYAGYLLAANGADVIKVEPPEGDWSRRLGTTYGSHSALSAVYNRGKRSLVLDLKKPEAIATARKLAATADVLVEGFRPGVMDRLGLGYDALSRDNSRLIYLSISGFGQDGPYAQRPCSDSVGQAFAGLVAVNVGADGIPHRVGATLSDVCTGLYGFQAISTALFARNAVGNGRHIDVSLSQSTAALLGHKFAEHVLEGGAPRLLNVPAGSYRTSDGWIMVTLVTEAQYGRLCSALQREDLARDPRFASFALRADCADELAAELQKVFPTDTTASWLKRLHASDLIADRILNPSEWVANEQVEATRGALRTETPNVGGVVAPRTPGKAADLEGDLRPAPDVGQDSATILLSGWS
ncbi:crotonobetainyl-CoA:carnitine CoA-transferase CaiB-like acyl-CoA transferase [Bradyrhizobium sp. USDA 4524]|uniref:CaiB/BaiF CoA transferase family protein n=1 Tax=Bradyrhizobium TaxID=374 RepID=UPI0020A080F9|nr:MULTISPECIES: CoA transferase [Bradyrhizobium]MCP1845129.1 crotonobetainyl-CoA:carnitine CoA-transferase CaiB-like acyl-CoA transferase [Bradyrhizobium sp. USDA 4538]MCP1905694.1 crotonobetainyl-CoA:carnitine CoA-transferase CaiB-like acyl-CoA transferase [Bradyrhizobium sp. USDA 4537]MCP1988650.1 crotonobetainyl-CoA:carnitine CoA-transferase CaiB-like acyl-CoA transferase [Bradyrhizobium sp. USDA 4539]MCP3418139.1 CoA transferase [Bradyrhizobium brasilense]